MQNLSSGKHVRNKFSVALVSALLLVMLPSDAGTLASDTGKTSVDGFVQQLSPLPFRQAGQSATQLADGRWLFLGGQGKAGTLDPKTNQFTPLSGQLQQNRSDHSATLLPNGQVLIWGGVDDKGEVIDIAEQFEPETGQFRVIGKLGLIPRSGHSATVLADGKLLLAGGMDSRQRLLYEAELFNPQNRNVEHFNVKLDNARVNHVAALLPNAQVMLWGGLGNTQQILANGELYDANRQGFNLLERDAASKLAVSLQANTVPAIAESQPAPDAYAVPVGQNLVIRFNTRMSVADLNDETVTLIGPHGATPVKVVPVEYGVMLFITPQQELLPASRYTLFIKGAKSYNNQLLPFTAIGFDTDQLNKGSTINSAAGQSNQSSLANSIVASINKTDVAGISTSPSSTSTSASVVPGTGAAIPVKPIVLPIKGTGTKEFSPIEKIAISTADSTSVTESWHPDISHFKGDWSARRAASPLQQLPPLQSFNGDTALAGQVLSLNGRGLANVTLSLGKQTTQTDATGRFLLQHLDVADQILAIDGQTVQRADARYGYYQTRISLEQGKTSSLNYTIWSAALDQAGDIAITSPTQKETVVTSPRIPGLELRIPAGTVIRDRNGKIVTSINMTAIPVDRPPFPLPSLGVPVYFTIQPGGAILSSINGKSQPGARLIYPNFSQAAPGTRMEFWNYDARGKGWYVYGLGSVTADGKQIEPDPGVAIYEFTGAMIARPYNAPATGPVVNGCQCGDPVDIYTGLFINKSTDHFISDIIPLEISRSYRQNDPASRAFGIGTNLGYDIFLVGDSNPWTFQDLVMPDGSRIHYIRTSEGSSYSNTVYKSTTSQGPYFGSYLYWDGIGWILTLKDGSVLKFPEASGLSARQGAIIGMRDRNGNALIFSRDYYGNLTRVTSLSGRFIQFTYDASNRITQAVDNLNRLFKYEYDTSGRLNKVTYPDQTFEVFTYDTKHNMLTVQDRRGKIMVTNVYDSNNRVIKQTYADTSTNSFAYTLGSNGKVSQTDHTDGNNLVTRYVFDANGYPSSITRAFGLPEQQTTTIVRDPATNLVQSVTDALSRKTTYAYDSMGNQTGQTYLAGTAEAITTSATYTSDYNQLAAVTDALNRTTSFSYDSKGNLQQIKDPTNVIHGFASNAAGQLTQYTDPRNKVTKFGYDGYDPSSVTDSLNRVTTVRTDSAGRPLSHIDPLNNVTLINNDQFDRVTSITDPNSQNTGFGYDNNDNLTSVTDANTHSTGFSYDDRNAVTGKTDALSQGSSIVYDNEHRIKQSTDRKNQQTNYTYDSLNRLRTVTYADNSTITHTYDAGNRLTQLADSINGNISFVYDNLDRITQVTSPKGVVNYTYDANGQRSTMTVSGQPTQSYTYDKVGRLTRIDQAAGAINNNQAQNIQFTYDDAGRLTKTTYANGITRDNSYDDASQLTGITYKKADGSVIGDLAYTYDANGRRTKSSGSLAKTDLPDTIAATSYDANNRLTTWGSQILSYDKNGNLTGDGINTYVWNARNQLIQIKDSTNTETASFTYDALGRRQTKTINGVSTGFVYDGVNIVQELNGFNATQADAANIRASYITAGVDQVLVQQSGTGSTATSLTYLTDAIGSTIRLTNGTGDKVVDYSYDPYGNTRADAVVNNAFQYTGRENDGNGLYYYRARYYSSATHRFIAEDPIGLAGGINGYGYVGGNPISFTDPSGRCFGPLLVACYYGVLYAEQLLIGAEIVAAISTGAMMPSASPATNAAKSTARAVTTIAEEIGTVQVFNTFKQAKTALGTQPGENIHHVVEQCQAARSGFSASALNTTNNLVRLPAATHDKISAFYSSISAGSNQTVRDSLNGRPFQEQMEFGLDVVQRALSGKL